MLNESGRIRDSYPHWFLWLTIALPVLTFVFGFHLPMYSLESLRALSSTIISAKVLLLSIVFSLVILGFSLVSQNYSIRATLLLKRNIYFEFLLVLFSISIVVDVFTLFFTGIYSVDAIFSLSIGYSLLAVISLGYYVNSAIEQTNPDGLIDLYSSYLSPEEYFRQARNYELGEDDDHPTYILYTMSLEALSMEEELAPRHAIQEMKDKCIEAVEYLDSNDRIPERTEHPSDFLVKPILEDFLPDIALSSLDYGKREVAKDSVDAIYEIGQTLLNIGNGYLARHTTMGLRRMTQKIDPTSDNYIIMRKSLDNLSIFMVDTLERASEEPENLERLGNAKTAVSLSTQVRFLRNVNPDDMTNYRNIFLDYYTNLEKAIYILVEDFSEQADEHDIELNKYYRRPEKEKRIIKDIFQKWFDNVGETVRMSTMLYSTTGRLPIVEGNFYDFFQHIGELASESKSEEIGISLWIFCIESAFSCSMEDEGFREHFVNHLGRAGLEDDRKLRKKAFERMKTESRSENGYVFSFVKPRTYSRISTQERSTMEKLLNINARNNFEEWLEELNDDVDEEIEFLRDSGSN